MKCTSSRPPRRFAPALAAALFLLLCHTAAEAAPVVGLTTTNRLVMFDSTEPGRVFHNVPVTGLAEPGEVLIGVDYRPANNRVYGVSSGSRLYLVNVETGAATAIGTGPFSPPLQGVNTPLGLELAFDIDPVQNVARVINCSFNYRIALDTGTVFSADTPPSLGPGQPICFTGAAYTNDFRGATSTTLYAINSSLDMLYRVGSEGGSPVSPNTGQTFTVGKMFGPVPETEFSAFDIAPGTATLAYVALTGADAVASRLAVVNLSTGRATVVGHIGGEQGSPLVFLRGMAALPTDGDLYAVTATNKLLRFNAAAPGVIVSSKQLTGLAANEQIVGIDFGHAVGPDSLGVHAPQLYALGSSGQVYVIDPETAAPAKFLSVRMPALEGASFGFEFFGGFLRITSDTGQNMTVSEFLPPAVHQPPAYAADDPNAGKTPKIIGLGLRSSILPSVQLGNLYGIDSAQNTLVLFDTNQATLRTVGPLSLFLSGNVVGFDIQTGAQAGYAAASPLCFEGCPTPSTLVGVDLTFGRATPVGGIGGGEQVRALAVVPKHSFSFARSAVEHVSEGNFALTLTVLRTDDASTPATVNYSTGEETNAPGAASPRSDFNAAYGTLRFAPGENVKTVQILLNEDSHVEQAAVGPNGRRGETFSVSLHDPSPGYFVGPEPEATVFIEDDNPEQTTNPIDDSENFVRQHYHDFFNREGDAPGIAFWTQNIESCGANNGCRTFKRAETSAAFFLSIEFQETGYLVYRFHETAYNRGPSLTFFDFLRDTSRVSEGVVVGQGDWQARLAANKQAYADEFVRSSLFVNLYGGMSNALYVDVLDQNAGGVLSATERAALIAGLNSNAITRAQALLAVAEDEDLKRNEKSRAFVYMQYIGYLRREPDEAGFNFWLTKLNNHGGDFRSAEMVKSFLDSGEYRGRFGPQ